MDFFATFLYNNKYNLISKGDGCFMRKSYLDNVRWMTVLLVMAYHVFYMFNAVGVLGGVGKFSKIQYQDGILYFVYPWFMMMLFLVAGISARYALERKTVKEFIKSRTQKLLIPSTLGLFVFQWIIGYYNIMVGGGLKYIPSFLIYPISSLSGTGPLWFIQLLWLFSLLLILIRKIDKNDRLYTLGKKCNTIIILLFAFLIWGSAQILNMPVITTYRFGIYFMAFLLGYFVFSHEEVQNRVEKMHLPMLLIAVFMGITYSFYYFGQNYSDESVLKSLFTNVYAWIMTLAVLGCAKAWFDKSNAFTKYMTKSSYGLYILHYLFILIPCYYLKNFTSLPTAVIYLLALIIVFVCTPVLYELMRRIPIVRYLVLGIKRNKEMKENAQGQSNFTANT